MPTQQPTLASVLIGIFQSSLLMNSVPEGSCGNTTFISNFQLAVLEIMDTSSAAVNITQCSENATSVSSRRFLLGTTTNLLLGFSVIVVEETNSPDFETFFERVNAAQDKLVQSISDDGLIDLFTDLLLSTNYINDEEAALIFIDSDSFTSSSVSVDLLNSKAPTSVPTTAPSADHGANEKKKTDNSIIIFLSIFIPCVVLICCGAGAYWYFRRNNNDKNGAFEDAYAAGGSPDQIDPSGHSIMTALSDIDPLHLMELADASAGGSSPKVFNDGDAFDDDIGIDGIHVDHNERNIESWHKIEENGRSVSNEYDQALVDSLDSLREDGIVVYFNKDETKDSPAAI